MASGAPDATAIPPAPVAPTAGAPNLAGLDLSQIQGSGLDPNQLMNLLRHLPNVLTKSLADGNLNKEDAAQTLSNLSGQFRDPGPSSHPHGPPALGHLPPAHLGMLGTGGMPNPPPTAPEGDDEGDEDDYVDKDGGLTDSGRKPSSGKGRGRGGAAMGSDEWTRQRKDNHKEVERRRRSNINEGINELGRIVPNGSGEKAKGAILSRAVQYIHHLKENEARNIEKWTLEKLLMDQAMGDLQVQLDEIRRMWDEERMNRQRVEQELEALRGGKAVPGSGSEKRSSPDGVDADGADKRPRTE